MRVKDRFTDEPIKGEHDSAIITRITESDYPILELLAYDIHYLSATDASVYFNRDYSTISDRLRQLRRNGRYLRMAPEQKNNPQRYWGGLIFDAIGEAGLDKLDEAGYPTPPKRHAPVNLTHQVMIDQVMLDILRGVRDSGLGIIKWRDLLTHDKMPEDTKRTQSTIIKLADEDGEKRFLSADGQPFVISRGSKQLFFIGMEADTGSERGEKMVTKLESYMEVIGDNTAFDKFGTTNPNVLFVLKNNRRKENIMRKWELMTEKKRGLRKHLLFTTHPLYTARENAQPMGSIVNRPLERVGLPPIILTKQEV